MPLQVNLRALRSIDDKKLQRLHNDALNAAELRGSDAYGWFKGELDAREKQLHALLLSDDPSEDVVMLKGRILELQRIRDQMIEGRVQAYKRFQAAIQQHKANTDEDGYE